MVLTAHLADDIFSLVSLCLFLSRLRLTKHFFGQRTTSVLLFHTLWLLTNLTLKFFATFSENRLSNSPVPLTSYETFDRSSAYRATSISGERKINPWILYTPINIRSTFVGTRSSNKIVCSSEKNMHGNVFRRHRSGRRSEWGKRDREKAVKRRQAGLEGWLQGEF